MSKTRKSLSGIIIIVVLVAIVGSIFTGIAAVKFFPEKFLLTELIKPESAKVDLRKPLRQQTRVVEIGGRTFEIPIMYFGYRLNMGRKQDSLLLQVIWPSMQSTYELKNRATYDKLVTHGLLGQILIDPATKRPDLSEIVRNRERGLTKKDDVGSKYGLQEYYYYHGHADSPRLSNDIYIDKAPDGGVKTFIDCYPDIERHFPQCSEMFIENGLFLTVTYNKRDFLSQWKEMKGTAVKFLDDLEVK